MRIAAIAVVAAIVVLVAAFVLLNQGNSPNNTTPSPSPTISPTASPVPVYVSSASPLTSPAGEYSATGTRVLFITSMGNITIQMRDDKPITATNFVNLVKQGFYDGTVFHRIISGFMIQGGQNQTVNVPSISDEIGNNNHNDYMTIAMAKTSAPNSATSEFFINVANNGNNQIDQQGTLFDTVYTAFGSVIGGQDIVMSISQVPVTTNVVGENSQPVSPVTVLKAVVLP